MRTAVPPTPAAVCCAQSCSAPCAGPSKAWTRPRVLCSPLLLHSLDPRPRRLLSTGRPHSRRPRCAWTRTRNARRQARELDAAHPPDARAGRERATNRADHERCGRGWTTDLVHGRGLVFCICWVRFFFESRRTQLTSARMQLAYRCELRARTGELHSPPHGEPVLIRSPCSR